MSSGVPIALSMIGESMSPAMVTTIPAAAQNIMAVCTVSLTSLYLFAP